MANYSFIVSYDGSRYEGWQRQTRTEETIQGKLEKVLRKLTGEEVQVIGAGQMPESMRADSVRMFSFLWRCPSGSWRMS